MCRCVCVFCVLRSPNRDMTVHERHDTRCSHVQAGSSGTRSVFLATLVALVSSMMLYCSRLKGQNLAATLSFSRPLLPDGTWNWFCRPRHFYTRKSVFPSTTGL